MDPPEDVAAPSPYRGTVGDVKGPFGRWEALIGIHLHEMRCGFVIPRHRKTLERELPAPPPAHLSVIEQEVQIGLIRTRGVIVAPLCEHTE